MVRRQNERHNMAHYVDNALEGFARLAAEIKKLTIEKVAAEAGIKPRMVKKFCTDPLLSKNSDITKIKRAVTALTAE
jgi:hypothetical protein